MTIKNMFKKDDVFSIDEAEEMIRACNNYREEIRASFRKLENPTKEEQALYDLGLGLTFDMKRNLREFIKAIRQ